MKTPVMISVDIEELYNVYTERDLLRKQVAELQAAGTENLDNSLYRMVRRFHQKFGHPVRHTAASPTEEEVRFRLSLILEEFQELFEAAFEVDSGCSLFFVGLKEAVQDRHSNSWTKFRFDFPAFYDALLDLAYVIEGTHAVCGTRAEPGLAEVQRANMSKDPAYVVEKDSSIIDAKAKPSKPADWVPPDIRKVLMAQGWQPE